jgi:NADH-quinone oxidoreductase subunit J
VTVSAAVFYAAAAVTVIFAAVMVVHKNPVKSTLALVVSFFGLAICYVLLAAPFIAALQVIVYAGAILVLFLFVLMLLNLREDLRTAGSSRPIQTLLAGLSIVAFAGLLLGLLRASPGPEVSADPEPLTDIPRVARLLFSDYLLPFEAVSILLLAALVGAFVLAMPEKRA